MEFYLIMLRMQNEGESVLTAAEKILETDKFPAFKKQLKKWALIQNAARI